MSRKSLFVQEPEARVDAYTPAANALAFEIEEAIRPILDKWTNPKLPEPLEDETGYSAREVDTVIHNVVHSMVARRILVLRRIIRG